MMYNSLDTNFSAMSIDDLSSSFVAFSLDTLEGDRTFNNCDGNQEAYLQHSQNGEVLFRGTACSSQDSFLSKTSNMSLSSLDPTARIRSVDLLLTAFFATSMDSSDEASLGGGFSNTVGNYAGPPTVVFEATPSCSNSIRGGDVDPNDFEPRVGAWLQETELIPAASDTARLEETVSASPDSVAARTTTQNSSVVTTAKDVLAERGGFANNHPGNKAASDTARIEETVSASPDAEGISVTAVDVIGERGQYCNNHVGSKEFRHYCGGLKKEFKACKDKANPTKEKGRIIRRVIKWVKDRQGRFLSRKNSEWYIMSDEDVWKKVRQA
eukprot:scaffold4979_cov73-Cylindrotheca_fusiformis.AAC.1